MADRVNPPAGPDPHAAKNGIDIAPDREMVGTFTDTGDSRVFDAS
ncbi:hypothetical protein ACFFP0_06555 [Rhizobium puerariae]|uniref:Uncharacterized protein n=1 Tax=Rhizobium puerariae TaxID=1585791 RepID=A0ABV6AF52_9HYPH